MNGDFKPDITRDSYSKHRHFSRVLMQQGRVLLDADWNEQTDILLRYMRMLASDILGPFAGPADDLGFGIGVYTPPASSSGGSKTSGSRKRGSTKTEEQPDTSYKVVIQNGRYYVDGLPCENDRDAYVYTIEDEQQKAGQDGPYLFYLDVWEREVNYLEDDNIREVALNGADTASRAEIIWQLRTIATKGHETLTPPNEDQKKNLGEFVTKLAQALEAAVPDFFDKLVGEPYLKARTLPVDEQDDTNPCVTPPSSKYRGEENQLYRVEVHTSGYGHLDPKQLQQLQAQQRQTAGSGTSGTSDPQTTQYATFKWSRENGSVVFPITSPVSGGNTLTVTLANLGIDDSRFTLHADDWVEIVDYEDTLERQPGNLLRVTAVDYTTMQVSLAPYTGTITFDSDSDRAKQLLLRRWDYQEMDPSAKGATTFDSDGALEIIENRWLTLEDGVQILFHRGIDVKPDKDADDFVPYYHTGDYWLIPARTATGDIEWPQRKNEHEALPPHGPRHHFAPIAYVTLNNRKLTDPNQVFDLRRIIKPVWEQILGK